MKILIIGANGMLGHALSEVFVSENPVLLDKDDLDITDPRQVEKKLLDLRPTLILNAAGFTDVDGAASHRAEALAVNAKAVGYLAAAAKKLAAILVHHSTEYVFDGKYKNGYPEKSKPNPLNVYGQSKAKGEELLQKHGEMFYLIRSSWLYGPGRQRGKPRGLNFVETIASTWDKM